MWNSDKRLPLPSPFDSPPWHGDRQVRWQTERTKRTTIAEFRINSPSAIRALGSRLVDEYDMGATSTKAEASQLNPRTILRNISERERRRWLRGACGPRASDVAGLCHDDRRRGVASTLACYARMGFLHGPGLVQAGAKRSWMSERLQLCRGILSPGPVEPGRGER